MALTAEELLEIKKALDTPGAIKDEAYRTWALEQVRASEDQQLQGYAAAGGTRADSAEPAPGELGVKGIIGQESRPDEAQVLAGQFDPRFDLMPQALALQPATTHPLGDKAAQAAHAGGKMGEATFAYEPPVSVVQKQLIENPAFARMLRPSTPPSLEEIGSLNSTSPLYQDAANYMWRKTAEAAAQSGRTVYRYSQTPYLWGEAGAGGAQGSGVLDQLKLKLGGSGKPLVDASNAFVMGLDDTAALGALRAGLETARPETQLSPNSDTMGVNEQTPQATKDVNRWTAAESPVSYGAGQALGMLAPWGVADRIFQGVAKGGRYVADAIAKTRLGAAAGRSGAGRVAGRVAADAAQGGVAAGLEEAGQQGVDIAAESLQSGQAPSAGRLAEAAESVKNVGSSGAQFGAGGSLVAQGARAGANAIRDSDRFDGMVRRTEPNLDWNVLPGRQGILPGPTLNKDTRRVVKQAREGGYVPSDVMAEELAPPIQAAAAENTKVAKGRAAAEQRNFQQTPEGGAEVPMTHLQSQSLEKLRDHYQPQQGGGLHAVDDKYRPAQKVFNGLVQKVSTSPIEGGLKLTPDEAASFLGARFRYQLIKDDLEGAAERAAAAPKVDIERDAYLRTIKDSRARTAADEEIEADIEDILGDRTPTPAARKKAEQQVLRERVEEEAFVEANGSLGDYLKQRGIDAVYVSPRGYDARRTDTLTKGLGDEDLIEAAKLDRQRRTLGGKKGGYDELVKKGEADIARAEKVEKAVAPGGDGFRPIARLAQATPGEKQLLDNVRDLADQAGVRDQLDRFRGLQDTLNVHNRASFRGPGGERLGYFNTQNQIDAGLLRAFPVLKALEGPLGPLGGGKAGRAALLGQEAPPPGEPSARSRYEAARDRRLKELAADRDEEKERREKRRARRAAGR